MPYIIYIVSKPSLSSYIPSNSLLDTFICMSVHMYRTLKRGPIYSLKMFSKVSRHIHMSCHVMVDGTSFKHAKDKMLINSLQCTGQFPKDIGLPAIY